MEGGQQRALAALGGEGCSGKGLCHCELRHSSEPCLSVHGEEAEALLAMEGMACSASLTHGSALSSAASLPQDEPSSSVWHHSTHWASPRLLTGDVYGDAALSVVVPLLFSYLCPCPVCPAGEQPVP